MCTRDQQERNEAASLKDFRDMFSVMNTAKNEGIEQGIEIGKEQGIEIGKEQGIEIGRVQEKLENARLMLASGMAKEQVIAILKLTDEIASQL